MTRLEKLMAQAEFALMFIVRTQRACDDRLRGAFQDAERRLSVDPRIKTDIKFANSTVKFVMRSEPDVDAGADFCYDFLNYAIRVPAPKDSCLQGDLCDSLIALGDLQALAIEDVIGDGEFESVEYCRKYLQWPAGENAKKALKESGGPMADLLL